MFIITVHLIDGEKWPSVKRIPTCYLWVGFTKDWKYINQPDKVFPET